MNLTPKRIQEKMNQIQEEHPLELSYGEDARYNWPNRWNALTNWLENLNNEEQD